MDKKKLVAAVIALVVVLCGAGTVSQCPWAKKQLQENVAPVFSGLF